MEIDVEQLEVRDNTAAHRFEIEYDGELAELAYLRDGERIIYPHTYVPRSLERHGIGARLAKHALEYARAEGLRVVPRCPFVRAYIAESPEYADLVDRR